MTENQLTTLPKSRVRTLARVARHHGMDYAITRNHQIQVGKEARDFLKEFSAYVGQDGKASKSAIDRKTGEARASGGDVHVAVSRQFCRLLGGSIKDADLTGNTELIFKHGLAWLKVKPTLEAGKEAHARPGKSVLVLCGIKSRRLGEFDMNDMTQPGFDYAALPVESVDRLQTIKRDIAIIDTLACVQIGQKLKEAQAELNMRGKSGAGFVDWVEAETPYGRQAAYDMINIANRFSGNDFQFIGNHFSQTVLARLAAPSTPESVVDRAIEKAESGAKVTVAEVKQWKEAAQAATQRAEEFRVESNERRKKIKELEAQVDLLESRPPEIQVQKPADYETLKATERALRNELADLKQQQRELVQQQVIAKLKEREAELSEMDRKVHDSEKRLEGLRTQIDRYSMQQRELKVHLDSIEDARVSLAKLAANMEGFGQVIDPDNELRLWRALAEMMDHGAAAIRCFIGDGKPALTVIQGGAA